MLLIGTHLTLLLVDFMYRQLMYFFPHTWHTLYREPTKTHKNLLNCLFVCLYVSEREHEWVSEITLTDSRRNKCVGLSGTCFKWVFVWMSVNCLLFGAESFDRWGEIQSLFHFSMKLVHCHNPNPSQRNCQFGQWGRVTRTTARSGSESGEPDNRSSVSVTFPTLLFF